MANKQLFASATRNVPTDTVNEAGGKAYSLSSKEKLAQFAVTCTFNNAYYSSANDQLDELKKILPNIDPEFISETAIYSRHYGMMKDMPAFLIAYLASLPNIDPSLLEKTFIEVIDNGRMLRNFVQFIRSGVFGRKSFGSRIRRFIRDYLNARPDSLLFNDAVGNDPSLSDIIKMVHPRGTTPQRRALYGYLIGREVDTSLLPQFIRDFEDFKAELTSIVPDVNFTRLTALKLTDSQWKETLLKQSWHTVRMNLNTAKRHGVFNDTDATLKIADILSDKKAILRSKAMPYQIFAAAINTKNEIPVSIFNALQDALDVSLENVPKLNGKVVVCVDTSGSMSSSITGYGEKTPPSMVRCVDVAALIASAILRKNPDTTIIPFDTRVHTLNLNGRDSVLTNANILAGYGGGGTNMGCATKEILKRKINPDTIIYVSDNQSWVASGSNTESTEVLNDFNKIRSANKNAKMICINLQPYGTTQSPNSANILNIGGWSDTVFNVIGNFVNNKGSFIEEISKKSRERLENGRYGVYN